FVLFFFSSRRRHTRFSRDWSSDVCSSDLPRRWWPPSLTQDAPMNQSFFSARYDAALAFAAQAHRAQVRKGTTIPYIAHPFHVSRSEERRVGKECRARWRTYQS